MLLTNLSVSGNSLPPSNPTLVAQGGKKQTVGKIKKKKELHFVYRIPRFQLLGLTFFFFYKIKYVNLNVLYRGNSKPLLYPLNLI